MPPAIPDWKYMQSRGRGLAPARRRSLFITENYFLKLRKRTLIGSNPQPEGILPGTLYWRPRPADVISDPGAGGLFFNFSYFSILEKLLPGFSYLELIYPLNIDSGGPFVSPRW
jgi:hypothetical protein